jgi:hypothetical protein
MGKAPGLKRARVESGLASDPRNFGRYTVQPRQAAAHRPSPPIRPTSNMQLVFAGRWPAPVGGGLVGERRRPGGLGSAAANMTYLTSLGMA